jgi:hypothetical protein
MWNGQAERFFGSISTVCTLNIKKINFNSKLLYEIIVMNAAGSYHFAKPVPP